MGGEDDNPVPDGPLFPQLLWRAWDEHSAEERAHHARLVRKDQWGFLVLTVIYLVVAWFASPAGALPEAPSGVTWARAFCAFLALHTSYMDNCVTVKVVKSTEEDFYVGKGPLGRFIWLTHLTISLCAIHFLATLVEPLLGTRLGLGTYSWSLPLGGVAAFVTIQFFTLVWPDPTFLQSCRVWHKRGVHHRFIMGYLHMPPLILAVADVCLLKHRDTLIGAMPSVLTLALVYITFSLLFVAALRANHAITGQWPYGLMKELGSHNDRWAKFVVVQVGILFTFAAVLPLLSRLLVAFW